MPLFRRKNEAKSSHHEADSSSGGSSKENSRKSSPSKKEERKDKQKQDNRTAQHLDQGRTVYAQDTWNNGLLDQITDKVLQLHHEHRMRKKYSDAAQMRRDAMQPVPGVPLPEQHRPDRRKRTKLRFFS